MRGEEVVVKKRRLVFLSLALGLLVLACAAARADDQAPMVVVFHEEGCPDCARMQTVLDQLVAAHPDLVIAYHEINSPGAAELLDRLSRSYGVLLVRVPVIFVGDRAIVGAGRAEEMTLREAVETCLSAGCPSPMTRSTESLVPWRDLLIVGAIAALLILFLLIQGL
jgi:glutaredoxin